VTDIYIPVGDVFVGEKSGFARTVHEYSNLGLLSPASGSTLLCFCVDAVVQKRYLC
jgi:hypothetical protein